MVSALLLAALAAVAGKAEVAQFSPQGTVKDVRQVAARFSVAIVPFGDPRPAAPFDVDCAEAGSGRWIDGRNWVYEFSRELPAGIRCSFTLAVGLAAVDGTPVGGQREFHFDTGGPAVRSSIPYAGSESIDEAQAFVLVTDAEPTDASVLEHVWFSVEGVPEKVGAQIVAGHEREEILASLEEWEVDGPAVVVRARQRFPSAAEVKLTWGAGVATAGGLATSAPQTLEFTTRAPFRAALRCERQNEKAGCVPFLPIHLSFTAPVAWEAARAAALVGPKGERWEAVVPDPPEPTVYRVEFGGPFPEKVELRLELPADLRDDAGRALANSGDFPLRVETADDPPLAKFSSRFGILEEADPVLPVTVRNLEAGVGGREARVTRERAGGLAADVGRLVGRVLGRVERIEKPEDVLPWLRRVGSARRTKSVFTAPLPAPPPSPAPSEFALPLPEGPRAFQVVGIPLASTGLHIVELSSRNLGAALLGRDQPMYVATAALVTNLAVHFKWGRANSLVWVTSLDDASPVEGAQVSVQDCSGAVLWSGVTNEHGFAITSEVPANGQAQRCQVAYRDDGDDEEDEDSYDDFSDAHAIDAYALGEGLLVAAQTPGDLSFVHTSWNDGIQPWRFQLPPALADSAIAAHTVFDRTLFRAGETVHMKHVLRAPTMAGFGFVAPERAPDVLDIQHLGGADRYELPLEWDANGLAETTWPIPRNAKLGGYSVVLRRSGGESWRDRWTSGTFRVEEFRVPLMRGAVQLPSEPQVQAREVPVDVSVQYLAGGPAANVPVRLRALVRPRPFTPPLELERFAFGNGDVREGRATNGDESTEEAKPAVHQREDLTLDAAGAAHAVIRDIPASAELRELLVEAEYRDPNGELQTVSATVPLWPAARLAGIETETWLSPERKVAAKIAVVDVAGKPVAGAPVRLDVRKRTTYSYRKRLVGGFYAYEHVDEIGPVIAALCEGPTDARGVLTCERAAPAEGDLLLVASVRDPAGNESAAHAGVWIAGDERQWFRVEASDRMDVVAEKAAYDAGDTARFQVRMPFAEATALVTAEREGVLDARVVSLRGQDPVVEVPVVGAFSPNVYVSVLAVRGRTAGIPPTAMVDLGKPAFKLGIAEIRVGWQPYELRVEVESDREAYRVREKAAVKVKVRTASGEVPSPAGEIALAAVDEGLLEMQPNASWNLLADMMGRRGYDVQTSTAQMQVVGKRHYGLKARPQGGGGGRQSTRELFDTLLLWRGRIALDANGEATAEVPLNDSLTSFRIAAVATAGAQFFGNGETTIRSTQDLMILSGLPPLVREGDRFGAAFTLRNTTAAALDVRLGATVGGLPEPLPERTLTLAAGESQAVVWDVIVPADVDTLAWTVEAAAGTATDRLAVAQRVAPAVPVRTLQATLFRWEKDVEEKVEAPAGALPGRGGVDVAFAPTLAVGLDGVREWMAAYPYTCLEQRVSRAVAVGDAAQWQEVVASLPAHVDADGLLKYFPRMASGSEVLTAYVLSIAQAAGLALPGDVQGRMEEALKGFVDGTIARPGAVGAADLTLRKLAALAALARVGKATPAQLSTLSPEPELWPTSALLDWWTVLRRLPAGVDGEPLGAAERILRARLDLQGTRMGFAGEERDALWWLMICADGNAARLVTELVESNSWRDDLPRLVRGLIQRQRKGHWDCTTSNAWGVLAVEKFVAAYESEAVSGVSTAALGGEEKGVTWTQPPEPAAVTLAWPAAPAVLDVAHRGTGHPWVTVQSRAAVPLADPLFAGYRVSRTVESVEARRPGVYSAGDILRLRLEVEAQAEMTWVVVDDPIPAGASHLGGGLGRDSQIATAGESGDDWNRPAYVERRFDAYRAYYAWVPKGALVAEYTIRLNQPGTFHLPATRVEALYAPEMFAELPNEPMVVEP